LIENEETLALECFTQALRICEELSRGDPAFVGWHHRLERLARDSAPLVSKPGATVPVLRFAADLQLTIAERRTANNKKTEAAAALAEAGPFLDALKQTAPADPAILEFARRAEALRTAIGDDR